MNLAREVLELVNENPNYTPVLGGVYSLGSEDLGVVRVTKSPSNKDAPGVGDRIFIQYGSLGFMKGIKVWLDEVTARRFIEKISNEQWADIWKWVKKHNPAYPSKISNKKFWDLLKKKDLGN